MPSSPTESRAKQLLSKGANDDAVAQATGLSKGAVITLRKSMNLPPSQAPAKHVSAPLPIERPAPPTSPRGKHDPFHELLDQAVRHTTEREAEPKRKRGTPNVFKDWSEEDYTKFIETWQTTPSIASQAEEHGITEEEVEWLLGTLKRNGVLLKSARAATIKADFSKLASVAEALLTPAELTQMKAKREKFRERMKTTWEKKRKSK